MQIGFSRLEEPATRQAPPMLSDERQMIMSGLPENDGFKPLENWVREDEGLRHEQEGLPQLGQLMDRIQICLEGEGMEFPVYEDLRCYYTLPHLESADDCLERLRRSLSTWEDRLAAAVGLVEAAMTVCVILGIEQGDIMEEVGR